jgi:hypothetical protein
MCVSYIAMFLCDFTGIVHGNTGSTDGRNVVVGLKQLDLLTSSNAL